MKQERSGRTRFAYEKHSHPELGVMGAVRGEAPPDDVMLSDSEFGLGRDVPYLYDNASTINSPYDLSSDKSADWYPAPLGLGQASSTGNAWWISWRTDSWYLTVERGFRAQISFAFRPVSNTQFESSQQDIGLFNRGTIFDVNSDSSKSDPLWGLRSIEGESTWSWSAGTELTPTSLPLRFDEQMFVTVTCPAGGPVQFDYQCQIGAVGANGESGQASMDVPKFSDDPLQAFGFGICCWKTPTYSLRFGPHRYWEELPW